MKRTMPLAALIAITSVAAFLPAKKSKIEPPTDEWTSNIRDLAPGPVEQAPAKPRKALLFWLHTGFNHQVIPHVNEVFKVLGEKSKAFEVELTLDIEKFTPESLARYDAVILNNNCSDRIFRNIFRDVLDNRVSAIHKGKNLGAAYADLTERQKEEKAAALEKSLIDFVASGKGIASIHGSIVMLNQSKPFCEMMGGNFIYHPPHQKLTYKPIDADHPLTKPFGGKPVSFVDELYVYGPPYEQKNFLPLLEVSSKGLKGIKKETPETMVASWIKRHEKGRVFYCSPGHYPHSYESTEMLTFLLNGMRYVLGDLDAPDAPLKAK